MVSPAQVRATTKYIKEHTRRYVLQCNNERDADVIEYLSGKENVNAFLKGLVRERMELELEYDSNKTH